MWQPVVGAPELQFPGASAEQLWLLAPARCMGLCFPSAGVPALPPLQTSQLLEHLSCRTVFFPFLHLLYLAQRASFSRITVFVPALHHTGVSVWKNSYSERFIFPMLHPMCCFHVVPYSLIKVSLCFTDISATFATVFNEAVALAK